MMRAGRDDAELVSAQSVGATVGRDRGLQALGELSQQRVTGRMAEAVVVRLEAVEVEQREDRGSDSASVSCARSSMS